jgi:Ca2+-binding RTX toxin-like protein
MARRLAIIGLAVLTTCLAAPVAHAALMASYGAYYGDPGESNHVTASYDGTAVTISDSVPITMEEQAAFDDQGACTQQSATRVRCAYPHGFAFYLGDGSDTFAYAGAAPPLPAGFDSDFLFSVDGEAGSDDLHGSPYADSLNSGAISTPGSFDRLTGGGGDDQLYDSDGGANSMDGGPGDDFLRAAPNAEPSKHPPASLTGRNVMAGGPGKDRIEGGWGDDRIAGNSGNDRLFGDQGRDTLRGGTGRDTVEGGPDRDVADGGSGNDALAASFHGGCGGPDTIIGGSGRDSVYIFCGRPTLKLRDHTRDTVDCSHPVKPKRIVADRKDRLKGRCARKRKRR